MATLSPASSGSEAKPSQTSIISSIPGTRNAPVWRTMASNTRSEPAREPVCEPAARRPEELLPVLMSSTGFSAANRRTALMSARPTRRLSRYGAMSCVFASPDR